MFGQISCLDFLNFLETKLQDSTSKKGRMRMGYRELATGGYRGKFSSARMTRVFDNAQLKHSLSKLQGLLKKAPASSGTWFSGP